MSQVIIFPRGQLSDFDREAMMGAGIIAVEADDPAAVVQVVPGVPLVQTDDLFMSALAAVVGNHANGGVASDFASNLLKRLKVRQESQGA